MLPEAQPAAKFERLPPERDAALRDQGRASRAAEHEPRRDRQPVAHGEDALALSVEGEADARAPLRRHGEGAPRDSVGSNSKGTFVYQIGTAGAKRKP